MARPDFVDTLTKEDVGKVVYAAAGKEYMKNYLTLLRALKQDGKFNGEPTLEYIAQQVSKKLLIYGIISERSRNAPSRKDGLLFHTHGEEMSDVEFRTEGSQLVSMTEDDKVIDIFSKGLIDDLRNYELKILEQTKKEH